MDRETHLMIEQAAAKASEQAVEKMLTSLGVDPKSPFEMQKDMAALRELRNLIKDPEFERDMEHLRKWRKTVDGIQTKGIFTVTAVIVTGVLAVLWMGFRSMFNT